MNSEQLTTIVARNHNLPRWDAANRVAFNLEELGIDPNNITDDQATEVDRYIFKDLQAGK